MRLEIVQQISENSFLQSSFMFAPPVVAQPELSSGRGTCTDFGFHVDSELALLEGYACAGGPVTSQGCSLLVPYAPHSGVAGGSAHCGEDSQRAALTFPSASFFLDGESRAFMNQFLSVANLCHS